MNPRRLLLPAVMFLCASLTLGSIARGQDSAFVRTATIPQLFMKGYEVLQTDPEAGTRIFEAIVARDSGNILAQRQLGFLYMNVGRHAEAAERFLAVQRLAPSDSNLLQVAYLYNMVGENGKALAYFGILRGSPDPGIAAIALRAVESLTPVYCAERSLSWSRVVGSALYEDRFDDLILSFSGLIGRGLGGKRTVSLYGAFNINADTRSTGGSRPVIYSDSYALLGGGLRIQPHRIWTIDLQPGIAFDLLDRPGESHWKEDFRAISTVGTGIFPDLDIPQRVRTPFSPFADGFLSYGYYSRYTNSIGYGQLRAGLRTLAYEHSALDLYLRGDLTFDTDGEYYNNTAEGSLGARIVPDHRWGINLLVEYHRGLYTIEPPAGTTPQWYSTFRLILVVDRFLCL